MGASVSPCLKVDVLFKKASSFILDRIAAAQVEIESYF